jgi:zinc transporter, ZIP family
MSTEPRKRSKAPLVLSALVPIGLLAALVGFIVVRGPGISLSAPAPIERIEFERVEFQPGRIVAHVINTGPAPVTVAQVQIGWTNRASWEFAASPSNQIPRLGHAEIRVNYPWVAGEPYEIVLITSNNLLFTHDVEVAAETPQVSRSMIFSFALLGVYVGVLPVLLGILWLPFLRSLPQKWYTFMLSLTVGLLLFLGVDSLHEALESAGRVPAPYQGVALILIGFVFTILGLYWLRDWLNKRRAGIPELVLAYGIAFSIGIHNLGEGLAIGGAYALGAVAVGTMLIIGFAIHNLTEGIAVVAPVLRAEFNRWHLVGLGLLAGGPTIAGAILGGLSYSPVLAVLFLAIGAGAIFQVVIEITRYQLSRVGFAALTNGYGIAGLAAGFAIMYVTGLLIVA